MRELDFRFYLGDTKIGAPFHGLRAFFTTPQVGWAGEVVDSWWVCGLVAGSVLCCTVVLVAGCAWHAPGNVARCTEQRAARLLLLCGCAPLLPGSS